MRKIFLTGGTGLLGKAFLEEVSNENFEVILGKRTIDPSAQDKEER